MFSPRRIHNNNNGKIGNRKNLKHLSDPSRATAKVITTKYPDAFFDPAGMKLDWNDIHSATEAVYPDIFSTQDSRVLLNTLNNLLFTPLYYISELPAPDVCCV